MAGMRPQASARMYTLQVGWAMLLNGCLGHCRPCALGGLRLQVGACAWHRVSLLKSGTTMAPAHSLLYFPLSLMCSPASQRVREKVLETHGWLVVRLQQGRWASLSNPHDRMHYLLDELKGAVGAAHKANGGGCCGGGCH